MKPESVEPAKLVAATLRVVAEKKHRAQLKRSLMEVAAGTAIGLLLVVVIDWFSVWENPAFRWAGPLIVVAVTALLGNRALKLFQSGPDKMAAARSLDRSQKSSQDRWTTFAALQPDGVGATGSGSMVEAMVRDMAPMCRYFDPDSVETVPIPRRTLGALFGAVLLLLGFLGFFFSQGSPRLLGRFLAPWAALPLTRIDETSQPPPALLRGSDLEITAKVKGKRPGSVWLEIDDGPTMEDTSPLPDRRLSSAVVEKPEFKIENLRETLRYRLRGGDATTSWQCVVVTQRPRLSKVTMTVRDPTYSSRPPRVWNRLPTDVKAIRGSELSLVFEFDLPIEKADLEVEGAFKRIIPLVNSEDRFTYGTLLSGNLGFRPVFMSREGFTNSPIPLCQIEVIEDQPPEVKLTRESESLLLSPFDDFEVGFEARDDIGIMAADLVFSITDQDGRTREVTLPIDLGEQKGKGEVSLKTSLKPGSLGMTAKDKIEYAVRVRDSSQQMATSGNDKTNDKSLSKAPENPMTKRPLSIGGGSAQSKTRKLNFATTEMLNKAEPKQKNILNVEAAFTQLKTSTISALDHASRAKSPERIPGVPLDTAPLFDEVAASRNDIKNATKSVDKISTEAPGTPYAFLSIQLLNIVRTYLTPAEARLNEAVLNRLVELPPREVHRQQAETSLASALAKLDSLENKLSEVRSQVKADFAMAEMVTMYVAQVEDIPVLLKEGGGTPYQRSPGEVDRAQAEAALKKLESLKELYKKTAEILQENPELWQRYMDKSKSESKIFRDELETLARRHELVRILTARINSGNDAGTEIRELIGTHQKQIGSSLLRSLDKAQTWIKTSPMEKPAWLAILESSTYLSLNNAVAETGSVEDLIKASLELNEQMDAAIVELSRVSRTGGASRSYAFRLGELKQARSESGLVVELVSALANQSRERAALYEQANIAHETQQLAGRIELAGVRLNQLSPEVESLGKTLNATMQNELLPSLSRSVSELQESKGTDLSSVGNAQAGATESFGRCLSLLDQFITAAIRELDKAPAKAGGGGGPKITAKSLDELERKLEDEKEMSESFGIPCCRPTNFQVMSDWERVASCSQPSPSPSPAQKDDESKPSDAPKNGAPPKEKNSSATMAAGNKRSEMEEESLASGKGKGKEESATKEMIAELARAEALKQAKTLAGMLSKNGPSSNLKGTDETIEGDKTGSLEIVSGNRVDMRHDANKSADWNRLSSVLRREILQEKSNAMPEEYRSAIETYFRDLSKWEGGKTPSAK